MRLRTLRLRNYRRHRDTRIEVPDGVVAVIGRNGSGKSTLLEALGFALFGVAATRTGKELLRWDGAAPSDEVAVSAELELGGQAVRIQRSLRGKNLTPDASLEVDGNVRVASGAGSSQAVTDEVERLIGMDRDAFFTTVVARQKELARLSDLGPADRKRLLLSMLGVDALDRAIATARGRARDGRTRVETLRGVLPDAKALAREQDAARAKQKETAAALEATRTAWTARKQVWSEAQVAWRASEAAREKHQAAAAAWQAAAAEVRHAEALVAELEVRLATAAEAAGQAEVLRERAEAVDGLRARWRRHEEGTRLRAEAVRRQADLATLRESRTALLVPDDPATLLAQTRQETEALSQELRALDRRAAVAEGEHHGMEERLERLSGLGGGAPCPVCEQPVGDHLPVLRQRLETQLTTCLDTGSSIAARRTEVEARLAEAKAMADVLAKKAEERRVALARRDALDEQIQAAGARLQTLAADGAAPEEDEAALQAALAAAEKAVHDRVRLLERSREQAALDARRTAAKKQLAATGARQEKAAAALAASPLDEAGHAAAARRHAEAQAAERAAERSVHEAETAARLAEQAVQRATERQDEARRLRGELRVAEDQARYWTALAGGRGEGLLERFKSHLVARVGPSVSQEASRLLAHFTGGRYTEVLLDADYRLFVTDGGVPYTLDRFSGGESDLVHLALRLAVSRLLAARAGGAELRLLALDEVFGSLDRERREHVLGALHRLGGLYSQVLLVTHQEELRDALDAVLLVEERDGEAVVTLANG